MQQNNERNMMQSYGCVSQLLWCGVSAILLDISVQYVSVKPYQISCMYWLTKHTNIFALSVGILFVILLGLSALVNNYYFAIVVSAVLIGVVDYSQYHKLQILREPIYPWDLNQLRNVKELLLIVRNMLSPGMMITAAALVTISLVITFRIPKKKLRFPLRAAFITSSALVILGCTHLNHSVIAKPLERLGASDYHWNQQKNYLENGFVLAFLNNIGAKMETAPNDYNESTMKELIEKYQQNSKVNSSTGPQQKPNIVYVMEESLFDPTRLSSLSFSIDPLAFYHRARNTYATGRVLSPEFGGSTSNVEFEALTGLNMSFMYEGAVPYQQVLAKKSSFPSIVSQLKTRGYEAIAIHPFDKTFYNRNRVYPVLGFDTFINQENMKYKEKLYDKGYISDMSAVKQVLEVLNSGDQPHFVHLVTMQNHLPIQEGLQGPDLIQVTGHQGSAKAELESYVQSIKASDQAIQYLVDSIQKISRPTIVVMFGDHLPALQEKTYTDHLGTGTPEQKALLLHETPLLIAANFSIPNQNVGTLSPSFIGPLIYEFCGQKLTAYYQLLKNVKQSLPGVSRNLYVDVRGKAALNLNDEQKKLLHDYELVQYDMLYGKGYAKVLLSDH